MIDNKTYTLLKMAEVRNYSQAARLLNMTQPAVSYQIRQLESDYGCKIFRSENKNLVLTPEGEIILKYARRMITLEENVKQSLHDKSKNVKNFIVGITPTAEENLVPLVFAKYCNEHPSTHIKIFSDNIRNIYDKLKVYEVDLAIIEGRIEDDNYYSILLDTDFLCLACSPKSHLAKKESISLEELKNEKLILRLPHSGTRSLFENNLLAHNDNINSYNVTMEIGNINTIKELVAMNYGVTIIANSTCAEEVKNKKLILVPIQNLSMVREINLVYHHDFSHMEVLNEIQKIYRRSKIII